MLVPVSAFLVATASMPALAADKSPSPVPYPHPLITEVLYAVPSGKAGDANGDGERQALGDEFIEIINPHDRPINLKGYTLVDADAYAPGAPKRGGGGGGGGGGRSKPGVPPAPANPPANTPDAKPARDNTNERAEVRFTFPDCELKPGQIVLVFNGYKSSIPAPVGDLTRGPSGPNDTFHGALVFSMQSASPYAAFGNDGDFVLLSSADGRAVQGIAWGKPSKNLPADCLLSEEAPIAAGSVQRESMKGKLIAHTDLGGDLLGTPCSPGLFKDTASDAGAAKPPATPAPAATPTPASKPSSIPAPAKPGKPSKTPGK